MTYIVKKLLSAVITIFIVSVIIFLAVRASGDPVNNLIPDGATKQQKELITEQLGLDKPLIVQYGIFITDVLTGDFGNSYTSKRPVIEVIFEKLPYTLELAVVAILIAVVLTIPIGSLAALKRNTWIDRLVIGLSSLEEAVPIFFAGIFVIQIFGVKLKILPVSGADSPLGIIGPSVLLGLAISGSMTMLLRNNMIQALESEYVKFARLRGIAEYKVVLKHALRNSFSSVLSFSAFVFANLIAGSVVIESVFNWPGIGMLSYNSVIGRDFPMVQAVVLILAVFMIVLSTVIDIILAFLDPRIRKAE